jgi:hypothetical protein
LVAGGDRDRVAVGPGFQADACAWVTAHRAIDRVEAVRPADQTDLEPTVNRTVVNHDRPARLVREHDRALNWHTCSRIGPAERESNADRLVNAAATGCWVGAPQEEDSDH